MKNLVVTCLLLIITMIVHGQDLSNLRSKRILITSDTTFLDTLLIVPNSLKINGYDGSSCQLLPAISAIVWLEEAFPTDTLEIWYRVFPPEINGVFRNKSVDIIDAYRRENPFSYVPPSDRFLKTKDDEIKTLGNISRGIGFGNKQDVVVNSNLNLRLSGKIQDDIEIIAAISDENNPFQPEGNTQQIQEFDRVFVQLKKDSSLLTAGDFQMLTPNGSYFMKYNKKSRGVQILHSEQLEKGLLEVGVDGAVSRGRFSRNTIAGIEGNQGPYRLQGSNGEIFIIIISGTEQVYLDGDLLVRGEQNDYVIDYNSGEVTFMPGRMITQYSRIVVEFQYSDRNYARSVIRTGVNYTMDKVRLRVNYFTEQDNKNQPYQLNLQLYDSISMRSAPQIIADAGDNEFAFIPRIDSLSEYTPSVIQYFKKDSAGYTIYVYADRYDSSAAYYKLGFSYVGSGNGNYVQKLSNANGKVFQWVQPVNGLSLGDYEPVEVLIAPKRQQMLNVGLDVQVNKNTSTSLEMVRSSNDLNTFSKLDSEDDIGYGLKYGLTNVQKLNRDSVSPNKLWKMTTNVSYEFTQKNFRYIERYRDVEFERKWNRTIANPNSNTEHFDENIAIADVQFNRGKNLLFRSRQSFYSRGNSFEGFAQNYNADYRRKRILLRGGAESVQSTQQNGFNNGPLKNDFERFNGEFQHRGKWLTTGLQWLKETSSFGVKGDSLLPQSYQYEQRRVDFGNGDSLGVSWKLQVGQRLDFQGGEEGAYRATTDGRDANLQMSWQGKKSTAINLTGIYRQLQFVDSVTPTEQTTQGRFEVRQDFLKRVLRTATYYQVGTGQEQRREYSYFEVGDGNGAYVWNDYDSNGIQSLNEFELASDFDRGRANFIRQFLPVQGFIKSYSSEFNHNLRIQPATVWKISENNMKKFIARFSNLSALQVQKKVTDNSPEVFLNPLLQNVEDTSLLTTNSSIRSVWSFNQSSPIFGVDYQWFNLQNKQLLVNGVDARNSVENKLKIRYNIKRSWEINISATQGDRSYISAFLTTRSYEYAFTSIKPQLGYQYKRNFRIEFYYDYYEAANANQYGGEHTFNHDFTSEVRLNYLNQGNVRISLGMVNINYTGNDNSPVAYELLNGLKNGRNVKWSFQLEQRFSNSIQLLISYDGRSNVSNPVIHIGRVQARYLF